MTGTYEVMEIGEPERWRSHVGGFDAARSREGRRIVDHELAMEYIGLSANALEPGEEAGSWHVHDRIEELYVFLHGSGEMGLDDAIVPVSAGTVVRVGQGVARTWRALPGSGKELRWLCIRAGGERLPSFPDDSRRLPGRPMPWEDQADEGGR